LPRSKFIFNGNVSGHHSNQPPFSIKPHQGITLAVALGDVLNGILKGMLVVAMVVILEVTI
jgi:hypothetical protein